MRVGASWGSSSANASSSSSLRSSTRLASEAAAISTPGRARRPFAHRLYAASIEVYAVVDRANPIERDVMMLAAFVLGELDRVLALDVIHAAELTIAEAHDRHVRLDQTAGGVGIEH